MFCLDDEFYDNRWEHFLNTVVSEESIILEEKGKRPYVIENNINVVFISNREMDERRFMRYDIKQLIHAPEVHSGSY